MSHNLEIKNNKASFVENTSRNEIAWHGLGIQVDHAMNVEEALKAARADYQVGLQPVIALPPSVEELIKSGGMIDAAVLQQYLIPGKKATMRLDENKALGVVSQKYGIVQNEDAFKFIDLICTGGNGTPVIETAGVLGHGERVFVSAKFPESICMKSRRDDLVDMYMVFTTSHDGSGAVNCMVTPVRVVCNNTLNWAMKDNIGKISLRHCSRVMNRLDLTLEENRTFAYKALNLYSVYRKGLQEDFEHLEQIKIAERELDDIIAQVTLSDKGYDAWKQTKSLASDEVGPAGRANFYGLKQAIETGVGQEFAQAGTGMWVMDGITTWYQNHRDYRAGKTYKLDSVTNGYVAQKVQKAHDLIEALA